MKTQLYCCIGGSMYTYDEEPDGRHLFVLLEDHLKVADRARALEAKLRGMAAECSECNGKRRAFIVQDQMLRSAECTACKDIWAVIEPTPAPATAAPILHHQV
jgi:hypothetical protein